MAKSKGGLAGLTAAAGGKTTKASKSSVPVISAPQSMRPQIAAWTENKRVEATATSNRKAAESAIRDDAQGIREKSCVIDGEYHTSIRLDAGDDGAVTMTQTGRFKKMTVNEHQDRLLGIFGDKGFDKYFGEQSSISIDTEKLTDEQANKIMAALGDDVGDLLVVETVIVPNERFTRDRVMVPAIKKKALEAETQGLAVPYAASFRL